jgi:hypothetical protein
MVEPIRKIVDGVVLVANDVWVSLVIYVDDNHEHRTVQLLYDGPLPERYTREYLDVSLKHDTVMQLKVPETEARFYTIRGQRRCAAIFRSIPPGSYGVFKPDWASGRRITARPFAVTEVDWRFATRSDTVEGQYRTGDAPLARRP